MENNENKNVQEEVVDISEQENIKETEVEPRHASPIEGKEKSKLSKKQKIQIAVSIIVLILVVIFIMFFFLLRKEDKKETHTTNTNSNVEEQMSNQEIVNQYGVKLEDFVMNYSKQNGKVPEVDSLLEYVKLGDYKISCKEVSVTSNNKVYLGECSVNASKETYSYGEKEDKKVTGNTLTVYRGNTQYGIDYTFAYNEEYAKDYEVIATIPCRLNSCEGYDVYEQYAVISEPKANGESSDYYIYDYKNKKYLDFKILNGSIEILENKEKFYGIYYSDENTNFIYSVSANKVFSVEGEFYSDMGWNPHSMLSTGYVPLRRENTTDFVNINTGKVIYSIDDVIDFRTDTKTGKVYILKGISKSEEEYAYTYMIYDSKGFELFEGEKFDSFYVKNDTFVTIKDNIFKVYNSNYQTIYTSKKYEGVMDIWERYILVLDGTNLNLIDYEGNILTTFINDWSDKYFYHSMLSGWYSENGKDGIYLVIEEDDVPKKEVLKNNPDMTEEELSYYDLGYEYYYIPTIKESGKIATYIGGYAKPVLYLYPILPMWINVIFEYPENLTTTYPKYKNNWSVLANPNGDLHDKDNKYYYGLYWEEKENHRIDFKEGFYVEKENAIEFLEEKLTMIGLNDRERNEFIMYWLPILEKNGKNLVYFELTDERNYYSPIHISPKPNSMLRVAIHVKKVNQKVDIKEQVLPTFHRKGFTAVEWGGVSY